MKSADISALYPNAEVGANVVSYSADHSAALPEHIPAYHAHIEETQPATANYMTSDFQSQFHIWIARLIGAKRVLEIGVYVGYSALVWAHAVGEDGKVTGLEFNEDYAKQAEEAFAKYGIKNIDIVVGDATQTIADLNPEEPYDLIFIDAQKSGYPGYLDTILSQSQPSSGKRLLRAGGLIIADNVLRRGTVADDSDNNPFTRRERGERSEYWTPADVESLRKFNDKMVKHERLEALLFPYFDGLGLAKLKD